LHFVAGLQQIRPVTWKGRHTCPESTDRATWQNGGNGSFGLAMEPALDAQISAIDSALRTLFASPRPSRPCPTLPAEASTLSRAEARESGALMRVNHVGEVCAQALYASQALATRSPALRAHFAAAAREETDHLAWTQARLDELGARPSLLNPLWYAGAFGIGLLAGTLGGDRLSLGFVVETERQVEAHLASHMERLPAGDHASRAIVAHMRDDEARHADDAQAAGAVGLPGPVKRLMRAAAKVMTTTAHHI
jgi:ubiquinone biosynthesis monooxygenase Coq7